jgi:amino acid transporter
MAGQGSGRGAREPGPAPALRVATGEGSFGRLRGGAIGVVGAVALTMAFMGPANSTITGTQQMALGAGYAIPLGMLLAMLACLGVGATIARFSRKLPSAGMAYTFTAHGLGRRAGFLNGWLLLLSYGVIGPLLLAALGGFPAQLVQQQLHVDVPWWVFSVFFAVIVWIVMVLGINREARAALFFLVLEVVTLTALALTIMLKGGAQGIDLGPFNPGNSLNGLSGLGTGMLWGIISFIGFESAGTLGEETSNPRRNVPRALYLAVTVIGVFYLFWAYASAVGFGRSHVGAFSSDTAPWFTLADRFWANGTDWILLLTVVNSLVAGLIGSSNATVRIIFSLGREGVLPRALGHVDRRQNPTRAATVYIGIALALALIFGVVFGSPFVAFGFFGTTLGLGICVVYIATNVALPRYFWRAHRSEFSVVGHAVVPVVASILILLPIWGQLSPFPAYPNNIAPFVVLAWILIGVGYFLFLERARPEIASTIGRVWNDDEALLASEHAAIGSGEHLPAPSTP